MFIMKTVVMYAKYVGLRLFTPQLWLGQTESVIAGRLSCSSPVMYVSINYFKVVKDCMYRFSPLLTKHTKPNLPHL